MSSLQAFLLVSAILAAPYSLLRYLTRHESSNLVEKLARVATIMFAAAEVMLVIAALEIAPEYDGYPLIITVYGSGITSLTGILLSVFAARNRQQLGTKAKGLAKYPVVTAIWGATVAVLSFALTLLGQLLAAAAATSRTNSLRESEREGPKSMEEDWWRLSTITGASGHLNEHGEYRRDDEVMSD